MTDSKNRNLKCKIHDVIFEADTFFPEIDPKTWREVSREFHPKDNKHKYDFSFVMYERIGVK